MIAIVSSSTDDVARACSETGLIYPTAAPWIALVIDSCAHLEITDIEREVRRAGRPLDAASKKAIGVRPNMTLGSEYMAALTHAGLRRASSAALVVVRRVLHRRIVRHRLENLSGNAALDQEVRIIAVRDRFTCPEALARARETITLANAPDLPLTECKSELCRCHYAAVEKGGGAL